CDYFRNKSGARPSVDIKDPDVQLNLFIQKGKATLYLDTSGAPLHKRGWRTNPTEASIHESLAAALLLHTHYIPGQHILCDPFCGSGTFLIEAAWMATHTPPGTLRKKWGFFHLPSFNMHEWKEWKQTIDTKRSPLLPQRIFGSDKSRSTVDLCREHLVKAGLSKHLIDVDFQEIAHYHPPKKPNFLITNPPYGKRLDTSEQLTKEINTFLSTELAPDAKIHIICPDAFPVSSFEKSVQSEFFFKNGGLPVKLTSL
ncbi:MAG: hypothetical protein FJZ58_08210, partial [Chlamydiae bacterium]|nr:hypothetical protein [Chlamydiota bacterium]